MKADPEKDTYLGRIELRPGYENSAVMPQSKPKGLQVAMFSIKGGWEANVRKQSENPQPELLHAAPAQSPRSAFSLRAIILGLAGVITICGLTPYNDYRLANTPLVGNNLPVGVVAFLMGIALFNAAVCLRFPRLKFSTGETAIAISMTLVACSIPSSGLLRYLPNVLVSPYWASRENTQYRTVIEEVGIPKWLLPNYASDSPADWGNDPLVFGYAERWPGPIGIEVFLSWARPIFVWAIFLFALYGALLCIVLLVRRQWVENERLSFPLAQVGMSLIEQAPAGQRFNAALKSRLFWMAFAAVFALHLYNGLANYVPAHVPRIQTFYNLTGMATDAPLNFARQDLWWNRIYFIVIGTTYFIPSSIAFSLWAFFILEQIFAMTAGGLTGDAMLGATNERHWGAILAVAGSIFWVGRRHWAMIVRQSFGVRRKNEVDDPYVSYPLAFWTLVGCTSVMIGWMVTAGCSIAAAVTAILLMLTLFIVITQVIAQTGLVHGTLIAHLTRPTEMLAIAGAGKLLSLKSFYLVGMADNALFDFREVSSVYASHGLKIASDTGTLKGIRRAGLKLMGVLMLALAVGYVVGFVSTLWVEYSYAFTARPGGADPINPWGFETAQRRFLLDPSVRYHEGNFSSVYNPLVHVGIGFAITATLAALRLRFVGWPLHPVGFLMIGTFPGTILWTSIMLGWTIKIVILRLGGAKLYASARPFFLGLIVGESLAAGFWLLVGIVIAAFGGEYRPIGILPG